MNDETNLSPIAAEMRIAAADLIHRRGRPLIELGVADWERLAHEGTLGILPGEIARDDSFQPLPAGDGSVHIVVAAIEDGVTLDYAAFRPGKPGHWGLRHGLGSMLGHAAFEEARRAVGWPGAPPLRLHRSPLEWLQAGATGACVIDGLYPDTAAQLRELDRIEVANPSFARRLRLKLEERPQIPEVTVAREARRCPA